MPNYAYKGRDKRGQGVDGEIEGASNSSVATSLMDIGVIPISIV